MAEKFPVIMQSHKIIFEATVKSPKTAKLNFSQKYLATINV